ncbi:MAG: hypothetical protein ACOC2V_00245 [Alkalispirochaeta sp.]
MSLFPLLLPLFSAAGALAVLSSRFASVHTVRDLPVDAETMRNPAIKALFFFVPLILVRLAFYRFLQFPYSLGGLYGRFLLEDILGPLFFTTIGAFFFNRRNRTREPLEQYLGYLVFFTVVFFLISGSDVILEDGYWTLYELFLRPLLYASMIWLFPVAITQADTATGGGRAALYVILAPFPAGLVPMAAEWLRPGAAILATLGHVALVSAAIYWELFRTERAGTAPVDDGSDDHT